MFASTTACWLRRCHTALAPAAARRALLAALYSPQLNPARDPACNPAAAIAAESVHCLAYELNLCPKQLARAVRHAPRIKAHVLDLEAALPELRASKARLALALGLPEDELDRESPGGFGGGGQGGSWYCVDVCVGTHRWWLCRMP